MASQVGRFLFCLKKGYNIVMEARIQKQLIVGIVFVLIFSGMVYGFTDYFFITEATCFDNIKNGKEEGLDCGSLACGKQCEPEIMPIEIQSTKLIKVGQGDYDVVARLFNPNASFGTSRLEYRLEPFGYSGFTYILPGQSKFIVLTSLKSTQNITDVGLVINNAQWQKLDIPNNTVSFVLRRKDYRPTQNGTELDAVLYNNSNFDFDKIDVAVILLDDMGSIVGVGKTDIRTFISKSERGFNVAWPFALSGNAVRQDVEASTNLFENSNFIKSYGTEEKFQKFY